MLNLGDEREKMKNRIFLISIIVSFFTVTASTANNNEIIILGSNDNTDVIQVLMQGNGEACNLSINGLESISSTTCQRLVNSNGIKIVCTNGKKICKTESEIFENLQRQFSSANSAMQELQMQHEVDEQKSAYNVQNNTIDRGLKVLMKLPVSYFYPNGVEMIANKQDLFVTVSDLVKYGFKHGKQSWEQIETNQYVFTLIVKDAFRGVTNTLKILFVFKSDQDVNRALMSRYILNGTEVYMRTGLSNALESLTYGAWNAKKTTENPNYFIEKKKKNQQKLLNDLKKLREDSNYYN